MLKQNKFLHFITTYISLLFILLFITPTTTVALCELIIEDNISSYINFQVDYFIEKPDESLSIEEIVKRPFNQKTSNAFSFGYKKNNFWFRLLVHNDSNEAKNMVLEITESIHKKVDLYIVSDQIIHKKNGLLIPLEDRVIQESNPAFVLHFAAHEKKELYINIASVYSVFGAIELKTATQFQKDTQTNKYIYIAYFSAIIIIALYNLIFFLYLQEKIYLYYISYVFVFILWVANYKGVLLPYIDLETYDSLQMTIPIFFSLLIFFSQSILETKKYFPFLHNILSFFILMTLVSLVWMLISMYSGFYFMNIAAVPLFPLLLIVAFWALYHKHKIAKLYLIALSVYIVGMSMFSLLVLGILPYNFIISHSAIIGAFFEIILFSLLLAYRINTLRQEALHSQEKLLKQQKTESTRLFHAVATKTKALNRAKKNLEEELKKKKILEKYLKHQAYTDPLTELMNRRAFFDIAEKELQNAINNHTELTSLIIDIDYFKKINDTYGHDIGDKVICIIAELMLENTRTIDYVGRIGGEEFAILMPDTDISSAFQISDRLRENISKYNIILEHKSIHITVSIGLSFLTAKDKDIDTIMKRADIALFKAKNNGRNKVCYI